MYLFILLLLFFIFQLTAHSSTTTMNYTARRGEENRETFILLGFFEKSIALCFLTR
jgi:hypothetical protein